MQKRERILKPVGFGGQGAILPHLKASAEVETVVMPAPPVVKIPLQQHIGAPAKPIVKKGDKVFVGTLIAEANGYVSAPVHSSVSGTVKEISSLENVQYIKNQAFDGCSVLSLINLPVGLKELGKNVFRNCLVLEISIDSKNALYHIENGVLYNKEKTILIEDLLKEKEREIEVLSSVTEIKDNAFNGSNVKKVIIKSFIKFGNNVFKDNDSLEGIVIDYNKLPSLLEDSISYGTKLYLLNGLIELVNEDYIFENYYIEGIIEFELDLIKAKVGEEIEVKINTPYEYKNENLIFRSSDNRIVKVENGKIIANSDRFCWCCRCIGNNFINLTHTTYTK